MKGGRIRLDYFTTAWMIVALGVGFATALGELHVTTIWWLSIHMITLGVLTNAILQWSWYFARSLLRLPRAHKGAGTHLIWRQVAFNISLVVTTVGMISENLFTVLVGASSIGCVLVWHGGALLVGAQSQLGSRFAVIIRFYITSAASLVIGCVLAGFIAVAMLSPLAPPGLLEMRPSLTLAHALINGLGWIGQSIAATLVTLGPTMLRTRIVPGAISRANHALPYIFGSVLAATLCALLGMAQIAGIFVLAYFAITAWAVGQPLLQEALVKGPRSFSTYSASAGLAWTGIAGVSLSIALITDGFSGYELIRTAVLTMAAVGGALQILAGALTYLMPVAVGGGPSAIKVGIAVLERGSLFRITLVNLALAFAILTMNPLWWVLTAAMYGSNLVFFAIAGVKQGRARKLWRIKNEL